MADTRVHAEVFHPSVFIHEELEARGWTLDDLALRMGGDFGLQRFALDFYMTVHDKHLLLGADGERDLARAFGTSPEFWHNLEAAWRAQQPNEKP
ncbi:MAG: helix-turn-helix transcriptional regulator [Stellaceae bacterium]